MAINLRNTPNFLNSSIAYSIRVFAENDVGEGAGSQVVYYMYSECVCICVCVCVCVCVCASVCVCVCICVCVCVYVCVIASVSGWRRASLVCVHNVSACSVFRNRSCTHSGELRHGTCHFYTIYTGISKINSVCGNLKDQMKLDLCIWEALSYTSVPWKWYLWAWLSFTTNIN